MTTGLEWANELRDFSEDKWRPEWVPSQASHAFVELGYCLEYNSGPFRIADVAEAIATRTDATEPEELHKLGEREWEWNVTLKDGRRFKVQGWHDYTGWDCQSGADFEAML